MVRFSEPSGAGVYFTREWLAFAGRGYDEERGEGWTERVHPDDLERLLGAIHRTATEGGSPDVEYRLRRHDGEYVPVVETLEAQAGASGEVEGCLSTIVVADSGQWPARDQEPAAQPEPEANYREVVDSIDEGFCVVEVVLDRDGRPVDYRFIETNAVFESQTGLDDPLGKTARELVPDLDDFWFETYGRVALTGEPVRFENHAPAMGRWFDVYTFRVGEPEQRRVAILFKDITARKRVEDEARYRGDQFRTLLDAAPLGVYLVDADFKIAQVNPVALPVFGAIPDLIGRDFGEVLHVLWADEYADEVERDFRHTLATGEPHHTPERAEYREDRRVVEYYEWQINRITLPDGQYGVVCYFRDISAEVRGRQAIAESEERYRTLFNSMDQAVCIIELILDGEMRAVDGRFVEVNRVFARHTGIQDPFGTTLKTLIPDLEDFWFEIYGEVALSGQAARRTEYSSALGRWFDLYAYPAGDPEDRRVAVLFNDVTARQEAEEALRESERQHRELAISTELERARLETVLEILPVGVWIADRDGQLIGKNEAADRIWAGDAPLGGSIANYITYRAWHSESGELLRPEEYPVAMALETGEAVEPVELRIEKLDGSEGTVLVSAVPILDEQGQSWGAVGINVDISERKRSEEALRESEARFRAMADGLPLMVWVHDAEGKQEFVNRAFCDFFGVTLEESGGDGWQILMHPEDADAYTSEFMRCTHERSRFNAEVRVKDRHGQWRWLESWGQPRFAPSGEFLGFVGTSADVTPQKEIEESLRSQREELEAALELNRMITDNAHSGLLMIDPEGRVTFMNPAAERITGFPVEELRGQLLHDRIHHQRADGTPYSVDECPLHRAYESIEDIGYFEDVFVRKDGSFFPTVGSVVSITRYGVHEGALVEFRDITEIRDAEEALHESETRFRMVTNVIPQLVWISDTAGAMTFFNDGWYDFTGMTGEESLGWGWTRALHPEDLERIEGAWRGAVERQERFEMEYRIRRRDGQYCWHIGRAIPLVDRDGRVTVWFGTCTDIDQIKLTEDELRRANAIKDEFLSLVSHELRTPLTTIVGLTRFLGRTTENLSDEARESVAIMARDSERLQTLIENLLVLARVDQADVELEPLLLPRVIGRVVESHRERHPYRDIEVELADDLPIAEGQDVWVEQVLMNGLSNAEKYSPTDEPITVRAYSQEGRAVVQVIDRGPGLPPEDLERIFEPFFRSSRALDLAIPGAGLGMSISRRLIELQGGTIAAREAETGGLLLEFSLPALAPV